MKNRLIVWLVGLLASVGALGQESAIDSLTLYHAATALNSGKIQQEMIYLHLDNNSYYRGDRIFFAGYLVTSGKLKPSKLSQTVYVELLNPDGKIIDRCVLKATDGRFNGSLMADEIPFYSGYYEVRAYTRYMLNFGPTAIYSRVIPVFASPKVKGDWSDRRMLKYGSAKHQFSRPTPIKIAASPKQMNGFDIAIENEKDSVAITVSSPRNEVIGVSMMCRGEICVRAILDLTRSSLETFKIERRKLPAGVIQLTLFDVTGKPMAERLFFNNPEDLVSIEYSFDKDTYSPYEPVELTVRLSEPVPFSLSITDAAEHVAYGSDICTELLLGSEIRGFVPNLNQYVSDPDSLLAVQGRMRYSWSELAGMTELNITQLPERGIEVRGSVEGPLHNKPQPGVKVSMMLNNLDTNEEGALLGEIVTDSAGVFAFRGDFHGDKALTLMAANNKGKRSRNRILLNQSERPLPRAYCVTEMQFDLKETPIMITDSTDSDDALLKELESRGIKRLKEVEVTADGGHAADVRHYIENAVTSYDVASARELLQDKGKKFIRRVSDIMPLIDPNFLYTGEKLLYGNKTPLYIIDNDLANNSKVLEYSDIDSSNPADLSVDMVKNIYVNTQQQAIHEYAIKFMEENLDVTGNFLPDELKEKLRKISPTAERDIANRDFRSDTYDRAINQLYGCVLFIELNENNAGFIRPGMRRTIISGYTDSEPFRPVDYTTAPPIEEDFRRTLYWNPEIIPDSSGVARIRFFNNGSARSFNVTASTITPDGKPGAISQQAR